jgi:hypothetical protein
MASKVLERHPAQKRLKETAAARAIGRMARSIVLRDGRRSAPAVGEWGRLVIIEGRDEIMTDAPKSAFELAMERLRRKDAEAGFVEQKLTDEQKAAIAEARSIYEARVAERQILHREKRLTTFEPAEAEKMDEEYRRDLERFASDRDAKIRRIREDTK